MTEPLKFREINTTPISTIQCAMCGDEATVVYRGIDYCADCERLAKRARETAAGVNYIERLATKRKPGGGVILSLDVADALAGLSESLESIREEFHGNDYVEGCYPSCLRYPKMAIAIDHLGAAIGRIKHVLTYPEVTE